jgi:hypothetical protein
MKNVILAYDKHNLGIVVMIKIVVMITTIDQLFLTQTACGLYIHSFSSNVPLKSTERICRQSRSETSRRAWETRKASKVTVAAEEI